MKLRHFAMYVLAALLVGREAQAFYNPQPGRWLSRDPAEERGGEGLYTLVRGNAVNQVDSDGRIVFTAVTFVNRVCGGAHAGWTFALSTGAPCEGYFVQKVTLQRRMRKCEQTGGYALTRHSYWEIWPGKVPRFLRVGASASDEFKFQPQVESNGTQIQIGVMRFVCARDFGSDDPLKWPTGSVGSTGSSSGSLPHSENEPAWWESGFEEASHSLQSDWICCCGERTSKASASPAP